MKRILIVNTGGTFNKKYNPIKGELEVLKDSSVIENILGCFYNLKYNIKTIIHKDSLDILDCDRDEIVELIINNSQKEILIIHGTDTMNITANFIQQKIKNRRIVLTGAMVPYSIDTTEANSNFSMALGYLMGSSENGVYIAMHGAIDKYDKIIKNRKQGLFERI